MISYSNLLSTVYAATTNPSDFNNGVNQTLEDIYSSVPYTESQGGSSASDCGQGWNKEHTVPQSWFGGASPMYSDAFHISHRYSYEFCSQQSSLRQFAGKT